MTGESVKLEIILRQIHKVVLKVLKYFLIVLLGLFMMFKTICLFCAMGSPSTEYGLMFCIQSFICM